MIYLEAMDPRVAPIGADLRKKEGKKQDIVQM